MQDTIHSCQKWLHMLPSQPTLGFTLGFSSVMLTNKTRNDWLTERKKWQNLVYDRLKQNDRIRCKYERNRCKNQSVTMFLNMTESGVKINQLIYFKSGTLWKSEKRLFCYPWQDISDLMPPIGYQDNVSDLMWLRSCVIKQKGSNRCWHSNNIWKT